MPETVGLGFTLVAKKAVPVYIGWVNGVNQTFHRVSYLVRLPSIQTSLKGQASKCARCWVGHQAGFLLFK